MLEEDKSNHLARLIQRRFPLDERPYLDLARQIDASEEQVLKEIGRWKAEGKLREISAVMEGAALGYDSALVCGRVPREKLSSIANVISEHPTVTHNYERNHDYNIWFTIAVPHEMGLENHLNALSALTGIEPFHALRRTLTFKVGVAFDFKSKKNNTERIDLPESIESKDVNEIEKRIIRALQTDLPVAERPFRVLADQNGFREDDLLAFARENLGGAVRRYIGTFRHRKMGVSANGMTVWNIPQEKLARCGRLLADSPEVSHCYARTNVDDFPYTLYSMLHGPDGSSLQETARTLAERIECDDYLILESPTEFKKTRLRYFLKELDEWWDSHGKLAA